MMGDVVDGGIAAGRLGARRRCVSRRTRRVRCAGATRASWGSSRCRPTTRCTASRPTSRAKARGKFDDVVVLGIGGSALGPIALRTALLKPAWNTLTRTSARQPAASARARQRRSAHDLGAARPTGARPRAVRRDVEVGRHRGDDGAVPRRPRTAERGKASRREERISSSSPIRRRARCARSRTSDGIAGARHSAGRRRAIQRADAGRNSAGGARGDGHGGSCSPGARDIAERCNTATCSAKNPAGRVRDASVPRRHEARAAHPGPDAVLRSAARHRRLVRAALGGESRQASTARGRGRRSDAARRARGDRPAQQGAAVHGGPARQDRHVHRGRARAASDVDDSEATFQT